MAHMYVHKLNTQIIVSTIRNLRDDVCAAKDKQIDAAERDNRRNQVFKSMMISVIVSDAAIGAVYFPVATPAALIASITLGGLVRFIPVPR